ncbi:MAG: helicase, partial [bacterium]
MTETPGAWLMRIDEEARPNRYSLTVADGPTLYRSVHEGDGVLIVDGDDSVVVGFARIYRIRKDPDATTFFFDGFVTLEGRGTPFVLGVGAPESKAAVLRLEWSTFEAALKTACGIEFSKFPVFEGQTLDERTYIRGLLQYAVTDDLLGPADGPLEEIVGMSVRDRYLVGKLAPPDTSVSDDQVEELSDAATGDPEGAERETDASTSRSLVPSSFGFTFCVDGSAGAIELRVAWGRYERTESERIDERTGNPFRCWKRVPSGGTATISFVRKIIEPIAVDGNCPAVVIQGTVGEPLSNGDRMVTLFLVNGQAKPDENQDQAWIFQPEMIARDPGGRAIFRRRPFLTEVGSDEERAALEMIY